MIRVVKIPKIDCGDKSGCLSEFVSVLVYIIGIIIFISIAICIMAGIGCGLANLFG